MMTDEERLAHVRLIAAMWAMFLRQIPEAMRQEVCSLALHLASVSPSEIERGLTKWGQPTQGEPFFAPLLKMKGD